MAMISGESREANSSACSVLDVGCGPGTNARRFAHAKYFGIDINDRYIQLARVRYHRDFLVADATTSDAIPAGSYDFILVNSFLHHLDTRRTARSFSHKQIFSPRRPSSLSRTRTP